MKLKNLVIGLIICIAIIIILVIYLITNGSKIQTRKNQIEESNANLTQIDNAKKENENSNKTLVGIVENKQTEDQEEYKDAAMITQDLQEMDINVGRLNIPKTHLDTDVYCKQNANKMEEVPCMLYTNEGPNLPGVTILVGHNRANDTLFSNNSMLEENDEFYFRDYINKVEKKYVVYSKFVTSSTDVSFYNTPSNSPIIAMQCCLTPTDTENVLIIMAKTEN